MMIGYSANICQHYIFQHIGRVYCFVYSPLAAKRLGKRATLFSKPFSAIYIAENTMIGYSAKSKAMRHATYNRIFFYILVQGDTSRCSKPSVDTKGCVLEHWPITKTELLF